MSILSNLNSIQFQYFPHFFISLLWQHWGTLLTDWLATLLSIQLNFNQTTFTACCWPPKWWWWRRRRRYKKMVWLNNVKILVSYFMHKVFFALFFQTFQYYKKNNNNHHNDGARWKITASMLTVYLPTYNFFWRCLNFTTNIGLRENLRCIGGVYQIMVEHDKKIEKSAHVESRILGLCATCVYDWCIWNM